MSVLIESKTKQNEFCINDVLERVTRAITAVSPLKDYVAVNPYGGLTQYDFLAARRFLRSVCDAESLMPLSYYRQQFAAGKLRRGSIEAALRELTLDRNVDVESVTGDAIVSLLTSDLAIDNLENTDRVFRTISQCIDRRSGSDWTRIICDEISKYCAAHYDQGQSTWRSPWQGGSLYQAWISIASIDRNIEILGLKRFRRYVAQLPQSPEAAIVFCLHRLGVPKRLWEGFLMCQAHSIPGWSAWTKYQTERAARSGDETSDLAALIAIRLCYGAALAEQMSFSIDWDSIKFADLSARSDAGDYDDDAVARYVLLRASEIAIREKLVGSIRAAAPSESSRSTQSLARIVFCIDVRSERIRRNIESVSSEIETSGFAGFFALPIEYVPIGQSSGDGQVPVLLQPQFQLQEGLRGADHPAEAALISRKRGVRSLRKAWKSFQSSAIGCFSFVETMGLFYGVPLIRRPLGIGAAPIDHRFDGVSPEQHDRLGPTLCGLGDQGITTARQIDMSESILRGIGLTDGFAKLVVFCGHGSKTQNNPLAAGLDCGACGGHTGESNARFAATLLNQPAIREGLAERGIVIPDATHFLSALHNTTTDDIEFFDLADLPAVSKADFEKLRTHTNAGSAMTLTERLPIMASKSVEGLMERTVDWSEVRPEWGLAGNAAFIVAPRSLTQSIDLDGRTFLHDYDHVKDPTGALLEQIVCAPMVVAHLINMQYYASTLDNEHFGSGTKTLHNVVGGFGIFSGNGGDLMTGLPWQSLHTGDHLQHEPVRLLAVIAAPRDAIDRVIEKHEKIKSLLMGGWLQLIAIDGTTPFRFTETGEWEPIE